MATKRRIRKVDLPLAYRWSCMIRLRRVRSCRSVSSAGYINSKHWTMVQFSVSMTGKRVRNFWNSRSKLTVSCTLLLILRRVTVWSNHMWWLACGQQVVLIFLTYLLCFYRSTVSLGMLVCSNCARWRRPLRGVSLIRTCFAQRWSRVRAALWPKCTDNRSRVLPSCMRYRRAIPSALI